MIDLNFQLQMLFDFSFNLLVTCGYLVVTCGDLVVTCGYLIATTGYFWLLLVSSRYFWFLVLVTTILSYVFMSLFI